MSGLGRYPLNIPSLSEAFSNFQQGVSSSNQRRDRLDYDDRRFRDDRDRDRDTRRDDDFRRDSGGSRGIDRRSSRDRFSPEPSYNSSYLDDHRQGSQSNLVSYPLGHLNNNSRSDRGNNRNDRNRNQNNRDRYRNNNNNNNNNNNRSQGNRGPSNQGPGILGAKPGDRAVPELPSNPLQVPGLPGLSGGLSGGSGLGSGLTAQLAQQQQQLMAMVQTQSLLAAMQAQANANAQAQVHAQARGKPMPSPLGGLLPTPLIPRTDRARDMQRQNRKRRNDGWVGGGGGNYGNKRERFDRNRGQQGNNRWGQNQQNRGRPGGVGAQNQQAKKAAAPDEKETKNNKAAEKELQEEETEEEGEDTQELDASQEEDKDDQEKGTVKDDIVNPDLPKSVNFIGEDVDSLMISLFDRQRSKYICQECKIICNLPTSFHKHLLGKRHARTVLENQGKEFDLDEFKSFSQGSAPAEKSETDEMTGGTKSDEREKVGTPEVSSPPPIQSPGVETNLDFVKYTCDTRKTAMKEGDIITISSVTQSRVKIDGFTSGRNMLGCEFVKAVSGFNCRLCKAFIRCGNDVISHIKGKKHQRNYQTYVQEHPQYEEHQLARNKELEAVLEPKEGEEVVLYEVLDKDIKTTASKQRSHRKDSQTDETAEVQITKFVVAPQSTDEEAQLHINCEAHDVVDLDFGDIEHMNDDSLLTEEGEDELLGTPMSTEVEELNDDPAEQTGVEESPANELTLSIIAPQLDESEDFIPLSVEEPVTSEEVDEPKSPLSITPRLTDSQDNEKEESQESETPGSSQEEIEDITPKENTPTPTPTGSGRRGKKSVTRGGAGRGGAARGRGRGRGSRRGARNAAGPGKALKAKKKKAEDADKNNDVDFMVGFEIIDEIGDGED